MQSPTTGNKPSLRSLTRGARRAPVFNSLANRMSPSSPKKLSPSSATFVPKSPERFGARGYKKVQRKTFVEPSLAGCIDPLSLKMGALDGIYEAGNHDIVGTIIGRDMTVTFQDGYTVDYELTLEQYKGKLTIQFTKNGYRHYVVEGVKNEGIGYTLFLRDARINAKKKRNVSKLYTWKPIRPINAEDKPASKVGTPDQNAGSVLVPALESSVESDIATRTPKAKSPGFTSALKKVPVPTAPTAPKQWNMTWKTVPKTDSSAGLILW